jgi:hypothetical protein
MLSGCDSTSLPFCLWCHVALTPDRSKNNIIKPTNMIISNGALQLATGSPAYGGIIIPEHFIKGAASAAAAAAEKVRRGLCTKNDRV